MTKTEKAVTWAIEIASLFSCLADSKTLLPVLILTTEAV